MKRKFILMTEAITPAQEVALRDSLGSPYWWHWLPNAWLIIDMSNSLSVNTLNLAFNKVAPLSQCLVLEVEPKAWNSMEKTTEEGKMSDWIKSSWMTP